MVHQDFDYLQVAVGRDMSINMRVRNDLLDQLTLWGRLLVAKEGGGGGGGGGERGQQYR